MNIEQVEELQKFLREPKPKPMVSAAEWPEETLVYGYDIERYTFHVYKRGGMLHRMTYRSSMDGTVTVVQHEKAEEFPAERLTPSKGVYWLHSNYEFVRRCAELGAYVHLKASHTNSMRPYHGHIEN